MKTLLAIAAVFAFLTSPCLAQVGGLSQATGQAATQGVGAIIDATKPQIPPPESPQPSVQPPAPAPAPAPAK